MYQHDQVAQYARISQYILDWQGSKLYIRNHGNVGPIW